MNRTEIRPKALSQTHAAAYIGKSVRQFQRIVARGDIVPRYLDSKPIFLVADLDALVDSAKNEPPAA